MQDPIYTVVKTDENDWAIVYELDGTPTPVAMSIRSERIARDMARHLNITQNRPTSSLFRSKQPDADLVITAGKGFHIRFANGRSASVQWGMGNYCDRQDNIRGRDFFEVKIKEGGLRKVYPEFEGPNNIYYEQMFADWGCDNAEMSPGTLGAEEGWMTPDKIVETLWEISKMPAIEGGKEPVDKALAHGLTYAVIGKMAQGTTDKDLLDGVSAWKETESKIHPRIHEWRNYLPEELLNAWKYLTPRERALCFYFCRQQAEGAEEWD